MQVKPTHYKKHLRLSSGLSRFNRPRLALWISLIVLPPIAGIAQARPRLVSDDGSGPRLPEIRTHAANRVPACVTPDRLDAFLEARNPRLDKRFKGIAAYYKRHGETYDVRWDFAFFQMLLETNYLSYMRSPGRLGDVRPRQNNFAGIGATGGGVPGESYPDVTTGVLVQIQHLVVYSGDRIDNAASPRTRENQDDIIRKSKRLGRAVTFRDLVNRWAMDRSYARSIESVSESFRNQYCNGTEAPVIEAAARPRAPEKTPKSDTMVAATRTARSEAPSVVGAALPASATATVISPPTDCKVWSASFGGRKALLVRALAADATHYTALEVVEGFETTMLKTFVTAYAPGGTAVAEFASQQDALAHAFKLCRTNAHIDSEHETARGPG